MDNQQMIETFVERHMARIYEDFRLLSSNEEYTQLSENATHLCVTILSTFFGYTYTQLPAALLDNSDEAIKKITETIGDLVIESLRRMHQKDSNNE